MHNKPLTAIPPLSIKWPDGIPPVPEQTEVIVPGYYRNKRGQIVYIGPEPPRPNRKLRRQARAYARRHKGG